MSRPEWFDDANCRGRNPDLFHPHSTEHVKAANAIRLCNLCPVRRECLEYALENNIDSGIWGGEGSYQRQQILRRRNSGK